jgi:hypothetical protein
VLTVEDWAEIRRLHRAEGMPIKAILADRSKVCLVTGVEGHSGHDSVHLDRWTALEVTSLARRSRTIRGVLDDWVRPLQDLLVIRLETAWCRRTRAQARIAHRVLEAPGQTAPAARARRRQDARLPPGARRGPPRRGGRNMEALRPWRPHTVATTELPAENSRHSDS